MKNFSKLLSLVFVLSLTLLISCKKDKETSGTHKVVFKAIGSADSNISTALYVDGSGKTENFTSLSGNTWTSTEYTISSSVHAVNFGANGVGATANSTLTVEIWVDGVKKADGRSTGTILSAQASYSF